MKEPHRPKLLNPDVMRKVVEKRTFQPPLGFRIAANAGKTPLDGLQEKYKIVVSYMSRLVVY